ncbi:hypothetical protein DCW30_16785 [Streptomyces alfalfae]|uniref:Uncharacterized protein n=1 Tax=Streptomyces alfalfae TaxID=1642299 RepID=A0ABM6H0Q5_9ACTN|nr:hypothetical protein [Streptomyces alfalfae]AYA20311.1 hypothetical protein D3X13_32270 [Streptomyces fradiae]APY89856.1 hypothetical protein A7J05_32975 [Streptomyces alfalfae]QUI30082.1 hypothetical protein H9W91_03840 [Streptomyces alfalfae]RXX42676.1 hypothetical protein DCW30_16785 [Streptomyces alfalfae]RZM83128.1 hypothetical protein D4104_34405 [Streptomyces alfalfae]
MTVFVITVPGTFVGGVTDAAREVLRRELATCHGDLSESEGLDLLTVNEDDTFSVRLEVDAADRYEAELGAVRIVSDALGKAGLTADECPLGAPAVTGIDSDL